MTKSNGGNNTCAQKRSKIIYYIFSTGEVKKWELSGLVKFSVQYPLKIMFIVIRNNIRLKNSFKNLENIHVVKEDFSFIKLGLIFLL